MKINLHKIFLVLFYCILVELHFEFVSYLRFPGSEIEGAWSFLLRLPYWVSFFIRWGFWIPFLAGFIVNVFIFRINFRVFFFEIFIILGLFLIFDAYAAYHVYPLDLLFFYFIFILIFYFAGFVLFISLRRLFRSFYG